MNPTKARKKETIKILIPMTSNQVKSLKSYLARLGIKCDGKKEFALIAEPRLLKKELNVKVLSINQFNKLDRIFKKMGFYEQLPPSGRRKG